MEVEKDYEEETSDFIPIDSVDLTGEDDEDDSEEQPSASPIASPQRQKQPKKTSITPDLSKHICYQLFSLLSLLIPGKIGNSYIVVIVFCLSTERKAAPKVEEPKESVSVSLLIKTLCFPLLSLN